MMDASTHLGNSVVPVGSCSVAEMKVTNERKERRYRDKKREKQHRSAKSIEAIVDELNNAMEAMKKRVVFSLGVEDEIRVVYMTDAERNTIIKKIPAGKLLGVERMADLLGVLIDKDG
jgi:uncharacterized FlaG/YvyC family protein